MGGSYGNVYLSFRCKLAVKDIRVSLPSPHGDGAKTQGHALYNLPLDAHARRRKAGEKTWNLPGGKQNIYILYSEISGPFHRRNIVSRVRWFLLTKSKFSTNKAQ